MSSAPGTKGIEFLERNPRFFAPFPDGRYLTWWSDRERCMAEIRKFSEKDARNYDHYDDFTERAARVMDKFILRRPPSFAEVAAEFGNRDEAVDLPEVLSRVGRRHRRVLLRKRADPGDHGRLRHHRHVPGAARGGHWLRQALSLDGQRHRQARVLGLRPWGDGRGHPGAWPG